jgi:flagellar hook-associated protein 1 FlgK
MADLFSLLSLGANALSAHSAASATASHNMENANTPGYARQRANLAATLPAYQLGGSFLGRGVTLQSVTQARDFGAEKQFTVANEAQARSGAQADALESLSTLDPQAAGSLGGSLTDFYSAMRALQQNPSDLSLRQAAVGQAQSVALAFNRTSSDIETARDGIDKKLDGQVSQVNSLATQMASLNAQIRVARASGAEPNDLLDARQSAQDQLVALTGATPIPTNDGDVNLAFPSGAGLVTGDQAAQLTTYADSTNGGHTAFRLTRTDGSGPVALTSMGGTFGGLLAARDGALKTAETSVDNLAFDWANTVNTVHRAGFGLDGVSGRDLFVPGATAAGAASRLTVNAAVVADPSLLAASSSAATLPGDGTNLQTLISTEGSPLSSGLDALDQFTSVVASYGAAAQGARASSDADNAVFQHATDMRQSVSGVSIDEEMVELTKAQRGYEAVMKVFETTFSMLDTLMTLKSST